MTTNTIVRPACSQGAEFLTVRDLARLLKIDAKTIYRYVRKGLIPYTRIQSNIRFRYDEILQWIERRHVRPVGWNGKT